MPRSFKAWLTRISYHQVTEACWLAIIFLVPLFFNPLSHHAFYLNKALLLQFLVITMVGFALAEWLNNKRNTTSINWNWRRIIASPLHLPVLIFGLLAIISTITSITPVISFWGSINRKAGLLTLLCWIAFFLVISARLRQKKQLFRALYTLLLSSGVVSVIGILEHLFPAVSEHFLHVRHIVRASSTTGNPLSLGVFLAMVTPLTMALLVRSWGLRKEEEKHRRLFMALLILLVLQFCCLYMACLSITILEFIVPSLVFLFLLAIVKRKKSFVYAGFACLSALMIAAALFIAPVLFPSINAISSGSKISALYEVTGTRISNSLASRTSHWDSAVATLETPPAITGFQDRLHEVRRIIGYGPETFLITAQSHLHEMANSADMQIGLLRDRPHNHYLYLATTQGLLGLAAFLWLLAAFFRLCVQSLRTHNILTIGLLAGMLGYVIDSIFNPSTFSAEIVFWLILALAVVVSRPNLSESDVQESPQDRGVPAITRLRQSLVPIACVSLMLLLAVMLTATPLLANIQLQKGLRLKSEQNPAAIFALDKATRLEPKEPLYWGAKGAYIYDIARITVNEQRKSELLELSTAALEEAKKREPYTAYRYYILANVYSYRAQHGAPEKWSFATASYDTALKLFPCNIDILNRWAQALVIKGDLAEAGNKLDLSISLDPDRVETSFIYGFLYSVQGNSKEAASICLQSVNNNPRNLRSFMNVCQDMATGNSTCLLKQSLVEYGKQADEAWLTPAMLGVTSLYCDGIAESLEEFDRAMSLVPEDNAGLLFGAILKYTERSTSFERELIAIIPGWENKLRRSQLSDSLVEKLDRLLSDATSPSP